MRLVAFGSRSRTRCETLNDLALILVYILVDPVAHDLRMLRQLLPLLNRIIQISIRFESAARFLGQQRLRHVCLQHG